MILPNGSGLSKRFWTATTSFKGMEGCTVITGRLLDLFIAVIGTFGVSNTRYTGTWVKRSIFQYSVAGTTGMGEVGTPLNQASRTFLERRVFNSLDSGDARHVVVVIKVVVSRPLARQAGRQVEARTRTK